MQVASKPRNSTSSISEENGMQQKSLSIFKPTCKHRRTYLLTLSATKGMFSDLSKPKLAISQVKRIVISKDVAT